jgi:plasmid stability protein
MLRSMAGRVRNLTLRRVPDDVHKALRHEADEHGRSLNAEILAILSEEAQQVRQRRNLGKVISRINGLREEVARRYPNQPDSVEVSREDRDSK